MLPSWKGIHYWDTGVVESANDSLRKGHTVDIRLIQSVGQNLPMAVRSNSSMLEYMTKDGMLDSVYEEGLGLDQPNRCMAYMASLVGHRYPRMNVFEIGTLTFLAKVETLLLQILTKS